MFSARGLFSTFVFSFGNWRSASRHSQPFLDQLLCFDLLTPNLCPPVAPLKGTVFSRSFVTAGPLFHLPFCLFWLNPVTFLGGRRHSGAFGPLLFTLTLVPPAPSCPSNLLTPVKLRLRLLSLSKLLHKMAVEDRYPELHRVPFVINKRPPPWDGTTFACRPINKSGFAVR